MRHPVDQYAHDVVEGRIIAGPYVRAAAQRHLDDRAKEGRRGWPWRFDVDRANHALDFFPRYLRLPDTADADGNPKPFILSPHQAFIVGSLFGWVDRAGNRRFRDAYVEIGKGDGKSPLAAGIGLYGMVMDGELAAEIYSAAVTKEQAGILYRDAVRMVECSPELSARIKIWANSLSYAPTHSIFRAVSAEHRALDGKRPHMALIDELHEHPTALVTTKIRSGAKRRLNPLFFEITNSGVSRTSICWQHHEHSVRVVQGTIRDDRWFAYVCALDEGDDPLTDSSCWVKTNPNLGVTIQRDYLQRQVDTAKHIPGETNSILRLNFCVWTTTTTREIRVEDWQRCQADIPDEDLVGRPCYGGLDLGQSDDLSAFIKLWELEDGRLYARLRCWIPEAAIETFPNRPYAEWIAGGWLEVTSGNQTDFTVVEQAIMDDCDTWGIRAIAYDKRYATQMAQNLEGAGQTCVDMPQGFQLNEAIKALSAWVAADRHELRRFCHDGNKLLELMAANFVTHRGRHGDKRPDKPSANEKIDGYVALLMAIQYWLRTGTQDATLDSDVV